MRIIINHGHCQVINYHHRHSAMHRKFWRRAFKFGLNDARNIIEVAWLARQQRRAGRTYARVSTATRKMNSRQNQKKASKRQNNYAAEKKFFPCVG